MDNFQLKKKQGIPTSSKHFNRYKLIFGMKPQWNLLRCQCFTRKTSLMNVTQLYAMYKGD